MADYQIEIPLTGATLHSELKRVDLEIAIAGQKFTQSFPAIANQKTQFTWDGKDGYGRIAPGKQTAQIRIGYVYKGEYREAADNEFSFGTMSGIPINRDTDRLEVTLWQEIYEQLGMMQNLEGWSLNIHHQYDPNGKTLYLGDGTRQHSEVINSITTVAGTGSSDSYSGEGGLATKADLKDISDIEIGPDGSIYIVNEYRIHKVGTDGIIKTIAGTGVGGYNGDGIAATQAQITEGGIVIAKDGSIYFADSYNYRIRKISPDGIITTLAGTGEYGFDGDGGLATKAKISCPLGIAIAPDDSIYFTDCNNHRIRRIDTKGLIHTIAGCSEPDDWWSPISGDGGPAAEASLAYPSDIVIANDGSIYFNDRGMGSGSGNTNSFCIRRIGPDGIITRFAGSSEREIGYLGDGGPATDALLFGSQGLSVSPDGRIYAADNQNKVVRMITTDGIITTIAGSVTSERYVEGGPATMSSITPYRTAVGPDGSVYISESLRPFSITGRIVWKVVPPFDGFNSEELIISSATGTELYVFDPNGKHLRTVNAINGTTIYNFDYDDNARLTKITDLNGQETIIQRDFNGNPTAIIGPYGQKTELTVDNDGYLDSIINPAGESIQLKYYAGGLLATYADPKNNVYRFTYDETGRLTKDEDPLGGYTSLIRTETEYGHQVQSIKRKDHDTSYDMTYLYEILPTGDKYSLITGCCGDSTEIFEGTDGSTTTTKPDGTIIHMIAGPDPRFGMKSPLITSMTITTPEGKQYEMTGSRTVTLSDSTDVLSLLSQTDTVTINGKTSTRIYDANTKTVTSTSPEGRQSVTTLDEQGRVVKVEAPGLAPTVFEYDERGRLFRTTEGTGSEARITSVTYAGNGLVDYVTDPLGRQTRFEYDPVGRVTRQILPGGKEISFAYDPNGNMTELTPPGRPENGFGYNAVDLNDTYTPPDVGIGDTETEYDYNLAKQPTIVTRPDGKTIGFSYDTRGRLQELLIPEGEITYAFHADTGNLSNILAPDSSMSYTYDGSLLEKTAWSGLITGDVSVTYNDDLMVTSQSVNDGDSVSYGYDDDGLLVSAGDLTVSRDTQNGMMIGSTVGSVTDSVSYNGFGELQQYQARYGGSTVYSVDYGTRDKLGRIVTKTETVNGETHTFSYVYDPNTDELTDVYKDGALVSHYDYDANGNRVRYTGTNGTFNGTYDDQDRMLSYGGNTYQYMANGELKSKTNADGTTVYDYDVLGNLRAVTLPDGTRLEYVIDGQNRRVGKKVNGVLTQGFLYQDQLNPVAELDGSGNVVARFVYATGINVPDYLVKGGVTYRIITDHLGSPRVIINVATGEIVQRMDYDEFGNVTLDTNPGFQPFGFAGGIYDSQTGLVRFGARDYDAESGRWTAKDPIGFYGGHTNLYAYCGNDPVNLIDPLGLHKGDKTYGLPREFWNWYHRQVKQPGDADLTKEEAQELYEDWKSEGKPDAEGKKTEKGESQECSVNQNQTGKNMVKAGGTAVGIYFLYRGIRLLPSLIPAFWPTLPANVAIP